MTPEEYLSQFASSLNISESTRREISKRHTKLREQLRELLPVEEDFLTGSYPRNTIIRSKKSDKFDVDSFLAFNKEDYGEFELPELLNTVRDALEQIKDSDSDITELVDQRRSIAVHYEDSFQIDVVPAIQIEKDKLYKIFDRRTQQPVKSNPKLHNQILIDANDQSASGTIKRLVPIIKTLKSWKRDKFDQLKSVHVELMAVKFIGQSEIVSFSDGLFGFFASMGEELAEAGMIDPANSENVIDAYLDEEGSRQDVLDSVSVFETIARKAKSLEEDGEFDKAATEWKKIFEGKSEQDKTYRAPTIITAPKKQYASFQFRTHGK
jgi:hypothetical protein